MEREEFPVQRKRTLYGAGILGLILHVIICVYPHTNETKLEKHICQGKYIVYWRHAKTTDERIHGYTFPGAGGCDAAAPFESDRGPGDLRLLFCGNFTDQPAENFAAPRVPAPGGTDRGAARRQMDALPAVDAARSRGREHPARDLETFEAEAGNAEGQFAAQLRVLRAAEIRIAAGRAATDSSRSSPID